MDRVDSVRVADVLARLAELEHGARNGADEAERLAGADPAAVARQRAFSEGEVSGLVRAQGVLRELAGWPSEPDTSHRP